MEFALDHARDDCPELGCFLSCTEHYGEEKKIGKACIVLCIYRSLEPSVDLTATLEYSRSCDDVCFVR